MLPDAPVDAIVPTWAVDSTSGKGVPASTSDWDKLIAAYHLPVSAPDHLWLAQEPGGSLADAIGAISLQPLNAPTYANAVAGWTRSAVGTVDSNINQGFATGALGDLDGNSYALLIYVAVTATPAAERSLAGIGASTDHRNIAVTTMPVFKATGVGGVTPASGTVDPSTTVHPLLMVIDATRMTYVVFSDDEKIATVPWTAPTGTGPLLMIGNAGNGGAAPARYLYAAQWSGTHAELADTSVKALLRGLGWTVTGF
jgi:hypothetical protein